MRGMKLKHTVSSVDGTIYDVYTTLKGAGETFVRNPPKPYRDKAGMKRHKRARQS